MRSPSGFSEAPPDGRVVARTGTTVVELLIALIVVTVGLLALAGAAAIVAREIAAGRREILLAWAARSRLERLTSSACTALTSGSALASGVSERWVVESGRNDTRRLTVVVEAAASSGAARAVRRLDGLVACP